MFSTHDNLKLPVAHDEEQASHDLWSTVSIAKNKPFLVVSVSILCDQEMRATTLMLCDLNYAQVYGNNKGHRIEKVQLMIPGQTPGSGWQLHDVVRVQAYSTPIDDDGSAFEYQEEYHTADGHCFTFADLSGEDPVRKANTELVYCAAAQGSD